jgi:hypothetical protein
MWKNYLCQLLNVHMVGAVRQTEMHAAETFGAQPSAAVGEYKGVTRQVSIGFQQTCSVQERKQ